MGAYLNGVKKLQSDSPEFTGTSLIDDLTTTGKVYLGSTTPILSSSMSDKDVWIDGLLQVGKGTVLKTMSWGSSLLTVPPAGVGTTHTGTCAFDYTGGTYENLLTVTWLGGWTGFTSDDVGKVIILATGAHAGGIAMVEEVIDTTSVRLETCGWDADITDDSIFVICDEPISFTSPHLKINRIGANAEWENIALSHTGSYANKFWMTAAADDADNIQIVTDASGFDGVESLVINHVVGALAAGGRQDVKLVVTDDSGCSGGSTTEINGVRYTRTKGASTATVNAIRVGTEFVNALYIDGSPANNPGYGYTFTSAFAVTDRTAAFTDPGTNVQIFTGDNTGILIGSDTKFSIISAILSVNASASITPVWQYSTGDGTWATLTVTDVTTGFRSSGKISFAPPALWAKSAHADGATGAITNAYYVRITRTVNTLVVPPTESYFKIYTGSDETYIRGDGTIKPVVMTDASAPNDSIYYSTNAARLVYKTGVGVVNSLY